jgi:hypothetical protein
MDDKELQLTAGEYLKSIGVDVDKSIMVGVIDDYMRQIDIIHIMECYAANKVLLSQKNNKFSGN